MLIWTVKLEIWKICKVQDKRFKVREGEFKHISAILESLSLGVDFL